MKLPRNPKKYYQLVQKFLIGKKMLTAKDVAEESGRFGPKTAAAYRKYCYKTSGGLDYVKATPGPVGSFWFNKKLTEEAVTPTTPALSPEEMTKAHIAAKEKAKPKKKSDAKVKKRGFQK